MLDMKRSWTCCVLSVTALDNSFLNLPYYVSFGLTLTWQFLVVCVFDNNLLVSCAYSMILHVLMVRVCYVFLTCVHSYALPLIYRVVLNMLV